METSIDIPILAYLLTLYDLFTKQINMNEINYKELYEAQCAKIVDLYESVQGNYIYHASYQSCGTDYHHAKEQAYENVMDMLTDRFPEQAKNEK